MPTKNVPLCNAASTKQCTKTTFGMRVKGVLLPPFFSALDQTLRCDVHVLLVPTAIVLYVFTNVLPMHVVFLLYFVLKY